jgi:hypothetical protein
MSNTAKEVAGSFFLKNDIPTPPLLALVYLVLQGQGKNKIAEDFIQQIITISQAENPFLAMRERLNPPILYLLKHCL